MTRYFFDVDDDGEAFIDDTGLELVDMEAAVKEARRALSDMVRDALREEAQHNLSIRIRDGAEGPVIITVTTATYTPAEGE